jgi:hypothetical protein
MRAPSSRRATFSCNTWKPSSDQMFLALPVPGARSSLQDGALAGPIPSAVVAREI